MSSAESAQAGGRPVSPAARWLAAADRLTRGRGGRWTLAAVGLVTLAALALSFALRIWTSSPLWLDEAQSVGIAKLPLGDLFDALRADGAPPLYYLLLHGWIELFGTGDFAVRSLSAVFSVGSVALLWQVGLRLGRSRKLALTAALLGATNPWMVRYASEARMYALMVALVLLGALALDAVLRGGGRRHIAYLSLATGALLLTHFWAMFLIAATGLGVLYVWWRRPELRIQARNAVLGLVGGGVLFLPWLPSFLYQISRTGAPWADVPGFGRLATLPQDWAGGDLPGGHWLLLLLLPLLVLGAVSAPYVRGAAGTSSIRYGAPLGRWLAALTVAALVIALAVTRITSSGLEPRYTAVVVPFVLLLVALGVLALPPRLAMLAVVALVVLGLLASWDVTHRRRTQAADFAAAFDEYAMPGDVVIYCPDQLSPSVSRLIEPTLASSLASMPVPESSKLDRVDWVDYEQRVDDTSAARLATDAARQAGGGAVWTFSSPRYKTHEDVCEDLRTELTDRGRRPRVVVNMDTSAYEHAMLERWVPRSPWELAELRFGRLGEPEPEQK